MKNSPQYTPAIRESGSCREKSSEKSDLPYFREPVFSPPVQGYDRTKLARDKTFRTFEVALKFLYRILKS